ncbi:NAD-dependent epimerase/dehydratase family protein [Halpernia sp.]|uniref:NAD-dependent epimerase/dehydratase family protein n=1 Tax=Halpernia sp. TaxID=2782209 RepID=UPI003A8D08FD
MKITITGYTGFVGQNLSIYLEKLGFEVFSLRLRNQDWKLKLNTQCDVLIHLASLAHDTFNIAPPNEHIKINTNLTTELFDQFLKSDIKDFFYFSSVKAVADTVDGVLIENVEGNPQTPYGKSKWKAEQYILSKKLPSGKRLFIIRPCMIHGPGNKGNLNLLYKIVEKGIPWPLTNFENQRSFLSIDNLNYLIVEMINNPSVESGVYNFADDESLSTNKLITIMNEAVNKTPKFLKISKNLIQKIAKTGDILHLPLNSERLKKLSESYIVSNQKIKTALDIQKLPINASDGIFKTIKSLKK